MPNQCSSLEEDGPNPGMVKETIPVSSVCCRLYRFLQWEYQIGNKSYLKLVFRKKKLRTELVILVISQEFLRPLGWTAEPCREQLSKHTWCETLTKHEQEIRAVGRSTEKAHTAAIHMSLTPCPDLRASAMVSAQEKGGDRLSVQSSCRESRHSTGGVKLLLHRAQGRCAGKWIV